MGRSGIAARLFLTAWLVYGAHLTSNVARKTYLAIAIGESLTFRVVLTLAPTVWAVWRVGRRTSSPA